MNLKWRRRVERGHDYYTSGVCIVNSYTEVLKRTGIGGRGKIKCHSQECNVCKGINYHLLRIYAKKCNVGRAIYSGVISEL